MYKYILFVSHFQAYYHNYIFKLKIFTHFQLFYKNILSMNLHIYINILYTHIIYTHLLYNGRFV